MRRKEADIPNQNTLGTGVYFPDTWQDLIIITKDQDPGMISECGMFSLLMKCVGQNSGSKNKKKNFYPNTVDNS